MLAYPVTLTPEEDGSALNVSFIDIPEALTFGHDKAEALQMAADALETAMDFYLDDRRAVPMPSEPQPGQHVVELPVSVAAKVLLLNEMIRQNVRPGELARRMNVRKQEITRLTDVRHRTRIDGIAAALKVLGKRLEVSVS